MNREPLRGDSFPHLVFFLRRRAKRMVLHAGLKVRTLDRRRGQRETLLDVAQIIDDILKGKTTVEKFKVRVQGKDFFSFLLAERALTRIVKEVQK